MTDSRGPWPLAGTVPPYHRHFFACTGRRGWPARLEEDEGLLGRMARDVRDRRDAAGDPARLNATDEPSGGPGLDLLVFPDALRYRGVDPAGWAAIERDHVAGGAPSGAVPSEPLPGRWVFVCVHEERDPRCGECGPPVLEALARELESAGLDDVRVRATSHVGGHKYAGNVIVYPEGVWYGYVRPSDAPRLVREHLAGGAVLEDLYRGSLAVR
ncbi:MAG TPA: sucrase/ferredoxin-like family protein [Gemmatimonadota bacterium]|nr:sucrase/ferredoxin-like family protein [Gemmatimonadota bacterium]